MCCAPPGVPVMKTPPPAPAPASSSGRFLHWFLLSSAAAALLACRPQAEATPTTSLTTRTEKTPAFLLISDEDRARYLPAAEAYLQKTRGADAAQFRLVPKGWSPEGNRLVISALYQPDGAVGQAAGGNSVELHLDRLTGDVVEEVRYQ
jgi:hypothetical protein